MKQCTKCKETKSKTSFHIEKRTDKPRPWCKKCSNEARRLHYRVKQNNPEASRSHAYRRLYGISLEEYNLKLKNQKGNCALCGLHESSLKKRLAVDHCKSTGKIRGLLCTNCNASRVGSQTSKQALETYLYLKSYDPQ